MIVTLDDLHLHSIRTLAGCKKSFPATFARDWCVFHIQYLMVCKEFLGGGELSD